MNEDHRVTVGPHTAISAWPLEANETLAIRNESGVKIEVEAGTLSHGRVQRINELVAERDAARRKLKCAEIVFRAIVSRFDYLQNLWGKEAITDETLRMARECVELIEAKGEPTT
jgi:hypothetical protein